MTLQGTVINGLIVLDHAGQFPEGARVEVSLKEEPKSIKRTSENAPTKGDWFQALQNIRTRREAEGYPFMTERETHEHIEWMREGDRIDELLREADEQRRSVGRNAHLLRQRHSDLLPGHASRFAAYGNSKRDEQ